MPRTASAKNKDALEANRGSDLLASFTGALLSSEVPDSVYFAQDTEYLGLKLYPRQKTLLRLIYLETELMTDYDIRIINEWAVGLSSGIQKVGISPDVWQRVEYLKANNYDHFGEVVNISGRRASKGLIGGVIGAMQNWRLLMMDDPQAHYGLTRGKALFCYVTATTEKQAKAYQFADLSSVILNASCFAPYIATSSPTELTLRTPADKRHIARLVANKASLDKEVASLINLAAAANSSSLRGGAAHTEIFDEMAHMLLSTGGPRTAEKVYEALTPSLTQVGKDGMIYIPTSPLTRVGQAYSLYQSGLKSDEAGVPLFPQMLIIQLPSWITYLDYEIPELCDGAAFTRPMVAYDEQLKRLEQREPESFKVEYGAQWADVVDPFLSPIVVDRIYDPVKDPITGKTKILTEQPLGIPRWTYRGHADPASVGANFAAMFAHGAPVEEDGSVLTHVFIDWIKVWRPADYENGAIDYLAIERELVERICDFPSMHLFSFDQYGGFATIPSLRKKLDDIGSATKVTEETFTNQSNRRRDNILKACLGMGWVHAYKDHFGPDEDTQPLLALELKFLQQDLNGKVDHPKIGPVRTSDLADCLAVICESLLAVQVESVREKLSGVNLRVGAPHGYMAGSADVAEATSLSVARQRLTNFGRDYTNARRGNYGSIRRRG